MGKRISPTTQDSSALQPNLHPVYVPPRITSYTSQEIIELIGPQLRPARQIHAQLKLDGLRVPGSCSPDLAEWINW